VDELTERHNGDFRAQHLFTELWAEFDQLGPSPDPTWESVEPVIAESEARVDHGAHAPPEPDLTLLAQCLITASGRPQSEAATLADRLTTAEGVLRSRLAARRARALSPQDALQILVAAGLSRFEARSLFFAQAGRSWFHDGSRVTPVRGGSRDASWIPCRPCGDEPRADGDPGGGEP